MKKITIFGAILLLLMGINNCYKGETPEEIKMLREIDLSCKTRCKDVGREVLSSFDYRGCVCKDEVKK